MNSDLSDTVGHFDCAQFFQRPQLLVNGGYDEAAIELLKRKGVQFYVVQGAELQDWAHLGTRLTDEQTQEADWELEMDNLYSVWVTEDDDNELPAAESEQEDSDGQQTDAFCLDRRACAR